MTLDFIEARIQACVQELSSLEAKVATLRWQHLHERLKIAKKDNHTHAIKAITCIIRKECQCRDWSTTNYAIKGTGMRSACTIQVSEDRVNQDFSD